MTEKEARWFYYYNKFEQAKRDLEQRYGRAFESSFLTSLLVHHYEEEDIHVFLLMKENIQLIDLVLIIEKELQTVIGQVDFDSTEFDFLLEGRIEKATIKDNGLHWVIHKYDADPFPSRPHAHESKLNVKLDLTTGVMYRKHERVGALSRKEFSRLKEKILQRGIKLPVN